MEEYRFTDASGFDYNYDPTTGQDSGGFDPYSDDFPGQTEPPQEPAHDRHDYGRYDQSAYPSTSYGAHRDWCEDKSLYSRYEQKPSASTSNEANRDRRGYTNHTPQYSQKAGVASTSHSAPLPNPEPATPMPMSPTPDYLQASEKRSSSLVNPTASRKLLILDLNGTLVYRSPHVPRPYRPRYRKFDRQAPGAQPPVDDPYQDPSAPRPLRPVHSRPYLSSFTQYLFHPETREWLDTMVWSSAQPHSVADMVDRCFGERKDELVAVWARDTLGLEEWEYHRKTQTTKDLAKPWAALPLNPPPDIKAGKHSAETTLLLDDSPLKAHLQPWNHLCIKEYVGEMRKADLELANKESERLKVAERAIADERGSGGEDASNNEDRSTPSPDLDEISRKERNDTEANVVPSNGDQDEIRTSVDVPTSTKKKRKRPKNKNRATTIENGTDIASDQPRQIYDQTLLAVIGILDTIKHESNVAGWMKFGGLWDGVHNILLKEDGNLGLDVGTDVGKNDLVSGNEASRHPEGQGAEKRRRISDHAASSPLSLSPKDEAPIQGSRILDGTSGHRPAIDSTQDLHPDSLSVADVPVALPSVPGTSPGTTAVILPETGAYFWYDNPQALGHWAGRGMRALEELGIDIQSGVIPG